MKRLIAFFVCCLAAMQLMAQQPTIYPVGLVKSADGFTLYNPTTSVWVDLRIAETQIKVGAYARYAQKLLGITVPVVDKTRWAIVGASLGYKQCPIVPEITPLEDGFPSETEQKTSVLAYDETGACKLGVDRMSAQVSSPEEMARRAADRIFEIRKCRYDLISGVAGENVFGAGLGDALKALDRMEEELMELFMGCEITTYKTVRYAVNASRRTCVVCRFDETLGLLGTENLSGIPVAVKFKPVNGTPTTFESLPAPNPKAPIDRYAVAENMQTAVYLDEQLLSEKVIPVLQHGQIIEVQAPKK